MPEVVEGNPGQARMLQEWREGWLTEVGGVDEAAALASEDEALILTRNIVAAAAG